MANYRNLNSLFFEPFWGGVLGKILIEQKINGNF
ncbi:UNVERIFIED_ORG: hypothetical protein EC838_0401 [Providencia alcalifaciens]